MSAESVLLERAREHLKQIERLAEMAEQSRAGTSRPDVDKALRELTSVLYLHGTRTPGEDHVQACWQAIVALMPEAENLLDGEGGGHEGYKLLHDIAHGTNLF